ncbi:GNAT family N-acetyltransferase [Patescibacteria group bacterium]|nr:GNAT family N-acetyltransferase [Patescibacteria group bacterium]MDE2173331.1 GNAT family N-acetyltransferase [Patescibacteria group bacterium]
MRAGAIQSGLADLSKESVMRILKEASLELHELQKEHLPILFLWRNSDDFMGLCSTRRNVVSLDEFKKELQSDFSRDRHLQFMIVRKDEYIGTLYSYNLNRTDGHAFATIFIAEGWRDKGYGAEAMIVFLEYLFREYRLYKVYAEVYSYNLKSLRALTSGRFVEEGRFRGHRLYQGERHDLIRMAFFESQVEDFAPLVKKLTSRYRSA